MIYVYLAGFVFAAVAPKCVSWKGRFFAVLIAFAWPVVLVMVLLAGRSLDRDPPF